MFIQKQEAIQQVKQALVHPYGGIILSKKEEDTATCNNLNGSQGNHSEKNIKSVYTVGVHIDSMLEVSEL